MLLLCAVLVGCSARFTTGDGGFYDTQTKRSYKPLGVSFEAVSGGDEVGTWKSKVDGEETVFRQIPGVDPARFLTDDNGNVYYADELPPDASAWNVQKIHVCEQGAVDVAVGNISDPDRIAQIRESWYHGESAEKPLGGLWVSRMLKMESVDCPGIYYCVTYLVYEDGSAYFYDRDTGRVVAVSEELISIIPIY